MAGEPEAHELRVPKLNIDEFKKEVPHQSSVVHIVSPRALKKQLSARNNCLCSPTTHAGSFRCRFHRNHSLLRTSNSVGSSLHDLDSKGSSMRDSLQAQ